MQHPWHDITAGSEPPERINAFIEVTQFDQLKYEIDKSTGYLTVNRQHRWGVASPFAYGFIPRTLCGQRVAELSIVDTSDGDALDVFVFSSLPIRHANVVVPGRIIGGIPVTDDNRADDKVFAVLEDDEMFGSVNALDDLAPSVLERIEHHLRTYKANSNIWVGEPYGRLLAEQVVAASMHDYAEAFATRHQATRGY